MSSTPHRWGTPGELCLRSGCQQHIDHVSKRSHRQLYLRRSQSSRHRRRFCQRHNLRCCPVLAAVWLSSPGVCYTPQGTEYSAAIGKTSTFNGINLSETYNSRLQPLEMKASSSAGNAFDITYSFVDPTSGGDAGHVNTITNNLNSSRSQSFGYDHLNRIVTAGTTATSGTYCWGYQYNYDAWGNLLAQAGWSPNYNGCSEYTMGSVTADGNNHISGFTYDVAGNTQNDGTIAYTYDAESQIKTAAGVSYTYDAQGRRVTKSNGRNYVYELRGEILVETDGSGNTTSEYIFFGGKRIAMLPAGGNPEYYAEDFLGSSRVMTQDNGTVCYDADFDSYGGEHAYTNNCPSSNRYKFEGKERDTETNNDDFGARYYTSRFGRWLSADWSNSPVPVPYANLTNPQTLNLYAMVSDDPESFADLDGHESLESQRQAAVRQAWRQEQQLVATKGEGTVDWTPAQKAELLQTGKVSGYEGHHINSVNGSPELAGDPNNIKFVEGRAGNLAEHGGNFQNPTTGELLNRASVAMMVWSLAITSYDAYTSQKESGISVNFFTGNTSLSDPTTAAKTLNGLIVSVQGKDGKPTWYKVVEGQYRQIGCQGNHCNADPNSLKGKKFKTYRPKDVA
jgi:RHS repeat-associated protein